jgi:regulator of sirC expression with transglutaminase-like and TPR domain
MSAATARFTTLLRGPEPAIPLDEAVLLVAAHAAPGLDVAQWLGRLDALAASCAVCTFAGVVDHVTRVEGFRGNRDDYYDPRNSLLPDVIDRRTGIPITLSIVAIEVGRRAGVPVVGVGLPGHFLVRDANDDVYADVFSGALLDREGCVALFDELNGGRGFDERFLDPTGTRAIVARVLANLKRIYLAHRDRAALTWALRLRAEIPGVPLEERRELASTLAADGQFAAAAAELERLVTDAGEAGDGRLAADAAGGATRLRARLN